MGVNAGTAVGGSSLLLNPQLPSSVILHCSSLHSFSFPPLQVNARNHCSLRIPQSTTRSIGRGLPKATQFSESSQSVSFPLVRQHARNHRIPKFRTRGMSWGIFKAAPFSKSSHSVSFPLFRQNARNHCYLRIPQFRTRRISRGISKAAPFSNDGSRKEGPRSSQAENAFVDVQIEQGEEKQQEQKKEEIEDLEEAPVAENGGAAQQGRTEAYGEVDVILASRVSEDRKTEYLILWRDEHPDSWEPAENIARDVVDEYEKPWWQAARKADAEKLKGLLESEEVQRDVNALDENERTALLFAAGLGSERVVRLLVEYGADVHWQDKDGYTALHIASGYVHVNTVKALVELGADPDLEDGKGRSPLSLAQELLERTPKANPLQFARRIALDQVVKALDEVMFETVAVEQVLDKRIGEGGVTEYLVKWNDESENGWVPLTDIGEDLVKDYEEGLEYGIVDKVLDKREVDGKVEYLVRWTDSAETWEIEENVGTEAVLDYTTSQSLE